MKLFYRHYGDGQPVIILHGILGISDNWVTIGRRLAEKFEVFIPDQRNHGQSPHSDTFSYYAMVDDLFEFIEDHQLSKPILIGHSMGGKVAMNFTLEHPHRIDKLIVVDISVRGYSSRRQHLDIMDAMLSIDFDHYSSREEIEKIINKKIKSQAIAGFIMKNLYRIGKNRLAWRLNINSIYKNIENVFSGVDLPYTSEIRTLFIKGGASDYILEEDYRLILQKFPNAEFKTIENASHWVHADTPEELCKSFGDFLKKECAFSGNFPK
jgi:pimeloyl-ACP methyl ester carboxylesterase